MKNIDYTAMGGRIRNARQSLGLSQLELAEQCGLSVSFLGHIERGSRIMSLETFVNICGALHADADELLWGIARPSNALEDMWSVSDKKSDVKTADSYSMYVRIMKSVAEIMNEA